MADVITIPRGYIRKKELVLIPRDDYEDLLSFRKQIEWEEKDTDEAIKIFKQEKKIKS